MAGEEKFLLRIGVDYKDAAADTNRFINEIQSKLKSIFAEVGSQGGGQAPSLDAGRAIVQYREQAIAAARAVEAEYLKMGQVVSLVNKSVFGEIDRYSKIGIGLGGSTLGGLPFNVKERSALGIDENALKRGVIAELNAQSTLQRTRGQGVSSLGFAANLYGVGPGSPGAPPNLDPYIDAAKEQYVRRIDALKTSVEFEKLMAVSADKNAKLAGEEAILRRLRISREQEQASILTNQQFRQLSYGDANTELNKRRLEAATNFQVERGLSGDDSRATAIRNSEAATLVEKKIETLKASIKYEDFYAISAKKINDLQVQELAAREQRVAAEKRASAEFFAGDSTAAQKIREDKAATELAQLQGKRKQIETGGTDLVSEKADTALIQQRAVLQERLLIARRVLGQETSEAELNGELIGLKGQVVAAEKERAKLESKATLGAQGVQTGEASLFQRLQQYAGSRLNPGSSKAAEEFAQLPQFLTGKAITTAGFAVSGGLLYGAVREFKDVLDESEKLQVNLGNVKAQFDRLGEAGNELGGNQGFEKFKQNIIDISVETGIAADKIVPLAQQLAGVFANSKTGAPDFARGAEEAQVALKFSQVAGNLPVSEITNQMTAIATSFNQNFTQIADDAVGISERFGGTAKETLDFAAALAPMAAQLGFSAQQLEGIGAIAQKYSGLPGTSLASSLGRVLPNLQTNQFKIEQSIAGTAGAGVLPQLQDAYAKGDAPGIILQLSKAYEHLTQTQRENLAQNVAGSRQANAFFAILGHGAELANALGKAPDYQGAFAARWDNFSESVKHAMDVLRRTVEELGIALFDSGIATALADAAQAGAGLLRIIESLLSVVGALNSAFGGLPALLITAGLALKVFGGVLGAVRAIGAATAAEDATGAAGVIGGARRGAAGATLSGIGPRLFEGSRVFQGVEASSPALLSGTLGIGVIAATAFAVKTAKDLADSTTKEIADNVKLLKDQVQAEFAKGVTPQAILARIPKRENPNFITSVAGAISSVIGGPSADDAVNGARDAVANEVNKQQSAVLQDKLKALVGAGANVVSPVQQKLADFQRQQGFKIPELKGQSVEDVFKNYTPGQDPAKDELLNSLIEKYAASDSGVRLAFEAIDRGAAANTARTEAAKSQLEQIDVLTNRIAAGDPSANEQLIAQFQAAVATAQGAVDAAQRNPGTTAVQLAAAYKELATQKKGFADIVDKRLKDNFAAAQTILANSGQDSAANTVPLLLAQLASTPDQEGRFAVALQIRDAEKKAFEQRVAEGRNASEQLAISREGFKIDDAAALAITENLVAHSSDSALAGNLGASSGTGISDGILRVAKILKDNDLALLAEERKKVESQIEAAVNLGLDASAGFAALAQLDALAPRIQQNIDSGADPTKGGADNATNAARDKAARDYEKAQGQQQRQAQLDLRAAQANGDPVALGRISQQRARLAQQIAVENADEAGRQKAVADYVNATNQLQDALNAIPATVADLVLAQNGDDPVLAAQTAAENANRAVGTAKGQAARNTALAAAIRADRARLKAEADRASLVDDLTLAQSGDDPIVAAQKARNDAQRALDIAGNASERLQALAQVARADKTIAQAQQALHDAQLDLLIAQANNAGDTILASTENLQKLKDRLNNSGLNLGQTERVSLLAQIQAAETAQRQTIISETESQIQTDLTLRRITKGQAVAELQALEAKAIALGASKKEIDAIAIQIQQLKGTLGQDFKYNLPSVLALPTLYEARRLNQTPGGSLNQGGYNDNRIINVNVYAQTGANPADIAAQVANTLGGNRTFGTVPRRY